MWKKVYNYAITFFLFILKFFFLNLLYLPQFMYLKAICCSSPMSVLFGFLFTVIIISSCILLKLISWSPKVKEHVSFFIFFLQKFLASCLFSRTFLLLFLLISSAWLGCAELLLCKLLTSGTFPGILRPAKLVFSNLVASLRLQLLRQFYCMFLKTYLNCYTPSCHL